MRVLLIIFLFSSLAYAEPFLVSDPYHPCGEAGQGACPESADIYLNGELVAADVALQPDLSIAYDLLTMPQGEVTYTAKYKDGLGRPSTFSDPFLLLSVPDSPQNLRGARTP